jgi:glycosyltransferase involved in cell wall biosynthesis
VSRLASGEAVTEMEPGVDRPSQVPATSGQTAGYVCMIAHTDYIFDARIRREAETLVSQGFNVLCLTTRNGAGPAQFVLEGVRVRELRVPRYQGKSTLGYAGAYLRFLLAASAACLRLLVRRELDVVHVHNIPDFLVLAALLPRLAGAKVVLDVHDSVPETFAVKFSGGPFVWKALCLEESLSARLAHRVICVNHPQRDALVARGIPCAKTFVSMNVPDHRIFSRASVVPQPIETGRPFSIVYHGTMAERLGVDLVIRAVARLAERIPSVRLHLWGPGDDLPRFQQLVRDLGAEERIVFNPKGFPLQELPRRLSSMHVGVVGNRPSLAGDLMLPVKLMEYLALGIPAVVPRLKAIEYYFTDEMVVYYEPENVQSLADAIYCLYSNPVLRHKLAERSGQFFGEYGWERQGAEFVASYRALLEN